MSLNEHRAANWNERAAGHTANDGYGIAALVADPDHISDVVAFDRDAFGAVITGIDFAPDALTAARSLAERVGVKATFVETELYDAPQHVPEQFDCIYTGVGAIN